ncbi:response regulator [uncultured Fibrella sp.]|uniref:response regulator n=1 Tax=uncultured Fibrella sp. TaxID=1284596 RepID=UPI0035C9719B
MDAAKRTVDAPVIFIIVDQPDAHYRYRQAFSEAAPTAVLYFFAHGSELITALRGYVYPRPSLLLIDGPMDGLNGYETLATLARTAAWQTIPVVIMTRQNQQIDEARCQQIGYGLVLPGETQPSRLAAQLTGLIHALL